MPAYLSEFLKVALGCVVLQGYGLTETAAGTCAGAVLASVFPVRQKASDGSDFIQSVLLCLIGVFLSSLFAAVGDVHRIRSKICRLSFVSRFSTQIFDATILLEVFNTTATHNLMTLCTRGIV